jgi:Putative prokaryotic signal transducing protein
MAHPDERDDYVIVRSFPDGTSAHLAAGALEAAGIPVRFADEYAASLYPLGTLVGGVKLLVPRSALNDAEAIPAGPV